MFSCLEYFNEPDILFKDALKSLSYGPNHILFSAIDEQSPSRLRDWPQGTRTVERNQDGRLATKWGLRG